MVTWISPAVLQVSYVNFQGRAQMPHTPRHAAITNGRTRRPSWSHALRFALLPEAVGNSEAVGILPHSNCKCRWVPKIRLLQLQCFLSKWRLDSWYWQFSLKESLSTTCIRIRYTTYEPPKSLRSSTFQVGRFICWSMQLKFLLDGGFGRTTTAEIPTISSYVRFLARTIVRNLSFQYRRGFWIS